MSRIRSIKPDWLDDELLSTASSEARVLSIGLILLADDYGNGRGSRLFLSSRVFRSREQSVLDSALDELVAIKFVVIYEVDGQSYFHIRNWRKHQRVDKPGKPSVPEPPGARKKLPRIVANIPGTTANVPDGLAPEGIGKEEEGKGDLESVEPTQSEATPGQKIRELEKLYPSQLCIDARAACALSRRNGKMADSVWAITLERLSAFPVPAVEAAMRTFAEKHADGQKAEAYLIGIARGNARDPRKFAPTAARCELKSIGADGRTTHRW